MHRQIATISLRVVLRNDLILVVEMGLFEAESSNAWPCGVMFRDILLLLNFITLHLFENKNFTHDLKFIELLFLLRVTNGQFHPCNAE